MRTIGTILLLLLDIHLVILYWSIITALTLLIFKLVLFLILIILTFLINVSDKQNLKNNKEGNLKQIELRE
ncbi:hypothetical protein FLAN108750_00990 [Flavobacterium antarcticum]